MPFNEETFLRRWRSAIDEGGLRRKPSYPVWQGDKAYRELNRAGLLEWVEFKPHGTFKGEKDSRSRKQLKRFKQAVSTYEDFASFSDKPLSDLSEIARSVSLLAKGRFSPLLKREAVKFGRVLQNERARLCQEREELFFGDLEGLSGFVREFKKAPSRKYELDARFQVKVGLLLQFHLWPLEHQTTALSLLTISRLVMLFYVANDLAGYQYPDVYSTELRTRLTGVKLKIPSIAENLRRAKLSRLAMQRILAKEASD